MVQRPLDQVGEDLIGDCVAAAPGRDMRHTHLRDRLSIMGSGGSATPSLPVHREPGHDHMRHIRAD